MRKTGKWSAVQQVDSMQFANCPMQWDNEFHYEIDQNPAAWRSKQHWERKQFGEKIPSILRDFDTDTTDDFYVAKEVISGKCIRNTTPNFTGWSIVLRTVIRWEEQAIRKKQITVYSNKPLPNHKPSDIERWEQKHGKPLRSNRNNRNNVRRRKNRNRSVGSTK